MSIDALSITPNPVNAQQTFVISVEASPEEVPIPETEYKLASSRYYCSFTYFFSKALLVEDGSAHAYSSKNERKSAIVAGFAFPELSGRQIVGANVQVYAERHLSGYARSLSASLVTDIQNGSSSYTSLAGPISYPTLTDSLVHYETGLIDDAALLTWLNNHASEGYLVGNNFGVRLYGENVNIFGVKLKFYYM